MLQNLNCQREDLFNLCIYRKNLRRHYNFEALTNEWSNKINRAYIPFSQSNIFLLKALIEFFKGKKVTIMMPYQYEVHKKVYKFI
jgi:hypothetical protein